MKQGVLNPKTVQDEICQLDKLFSSPQVASEVLKYLDSNRVSVTHLTKLISIDAVLVSRVMKLANSENYGYSGQISTLNLAIITIGLPSLIDLLRGISAIDQFNFQFTHLHKQLKDLWLHSAMVGSGAKKFSNLIGYPVAGEAFVAGLLHDIGYQVLYQLYPDHLSEVINLSIKSGITKYEAEKQLMGLDHCQLGAWLAKSWNFPEKVVTAIEFHHNPAKADDYSDLVNLTFYSNIFSHFFDGSNRECNEDSLTDIKEKFKKSFNVNGRFSLDFHDFFKLRCRKFDQLLKSQDFNSNYN
jgi:putative nucleotidyltransferase with HDIG domain